MIDREPSRGFTEEKGTFKVVLKDKFILGVWKICNTAK